MADLSSLMENKLVIGVVIGAVILLWSLAEVWWYWYRPWSPGEGVKDEMLRQYGGSRTWVVLFVITIVLLGIWVVATSGWTPACCDSPRSGVEAPYSN
jgi:Gpi18-like mannosyltransferase